MTRTVQRKATAEPMSITARTTQLREWAALKFEDAGLTKRMGKIRDALMAEAETHGTADSNGHLYLDVKPFTFEGKTYGAIKRERRVSQLFDDDKALKLAEKKNVRDRVIKTVEVLDQDEFYVLNQEGIISDKELDGLISSKVTWAFQQVAE